MDQSIMQHPNSAVLGSVKIEIADEVNIVTDANGKKTWQMLGFTDLGLGRGFSATPASTNIEIKADNGTVPISGKTDVSYAIAGNLLERHLPTIGKILAGQVTVTAESGVASSSTEVYPVGAWGINEFIPFGHYNADGSAPTNIIVAVNNIELDDAFYYVTKMYDTWGVLFDRTMVDATYETHPCKISYTVTPPVGYTLKRGSGGMGTHYALRLTNKREADDGSLITHIWEFPYVVFDGEQAMTFKSSGDADNLMEVPISFKATPHPDMVGDDSLRLECLMRETVSGKVD
jgi:hypothetical protein